MLEIQQARNQVRRARRSTFARHEALTHRAAWPIPVEKVIWPNRPIASRRSVLSADAGRILAPTKPLSGDLLFVENVGFSRGCARSPKPHNVIFRLTDR
jgi:hypothetical protein